jgi:hypothetical protein
MKFIKNKKLMVGLLLFILAVAAVYRVILYDTSTPPTDVTLLPPFTKGREDQKSAFINNVEVTPGTTRFDSVSGIFGDMISEQRTRTGRIYEFDWRGRYQPITVIVDNNGFIQYIRTPQFGSSYGDLDNHIRERGLGDPDLEWYLHNQFNMKAYVYLNEGIVFEAEEYNREVITIRYFTPTTREEFLRTWGSDLQSEQPEHSHGKGSDQWEGVNVDEYCFDC